jgi:ribosome-binding factor A
LVSKFRAARISERIREELSDLLIKQVNDPRLAGVSITDVEVDRELAFANIYFSAIEGSERAAEIKDGFQHAQGFLRAELSHRINLRVFPRLRFHWDPTFERAERIEQLFTELHQQEESANQAFPTQNDDNAGDENAAE